VRKPLLVGSPGFRMKYAGLKDPGEGEGSSGRERDRGSEEVRRQIEKSGIQGGEGSSHVSQG